MKIEVLGPGCPRCHTMADAAERAVVKLGVTATVDKVTDINEITARGVMMTPALIIDGDVKVSGRVPSQQEIEAWLS